MSSMYHGRVKFTREQLNFVVEVMIVSFVDLFLSSCPGRYEDGSRDKQWKKNRKAYPKNLKPTVKEHLWHLGWNLSIFYAQLCTDGIGESDALEIAKLNSTLGNWATRYASGEIGVIPHRDGGGGTYNVPDTRVLAVQWVNEAFNGEYL